jgi:hypothetical protein
MHNSEKTILDFSKAKANEVSVIADYQKQRLDIWLEYLQTDSSEYSNTQTIMTSVNVVRIP